MWCLTGRDVLCLSCLNGCRNGGREARLFEPDVLRVWKSFILHDNDRTLCLLLEPHRIIRAKRARLAAAAC